MEKLPLILAFVLCTLFSFNSQAQEKNTLIEGNGASVERNMNLFGELGIKIMSLKGDAAPAFDAKLGVGFAENISAGIGFQTSISNLQPETELDPEVFYNMYFGSVFIEYNWNPNSVFSISTPLQLGAGINKLINESDEDVQGLESDKIIAIIPSVKGNFNISQKVSFNLGVGYRVIGLIADSRGLSSGDFSGFEGGVGLRFNIL